MTEQYYWLYEPNGPLGWRERREQTKKPVPRAKAQERMKAEAAAAAAAPEAAAP